MRVPRAAAVITSAVLLPLFATANGAAATHHDRGSTTPRRLQIMVTNDDGYNAPGIAAVSSALARLPNVHVVVVAPATNQSGSGGSTTKGQLKITKRKTLNGLPAYAVNGTPADTIRAGLNQLHLHPDLVVSGINAGQNLGPMVDLSGTVGAARAAVARGIPSLAASAGLGNTIRFNAAVPFVLNWVKHMRSALLNHKAAVHVVSMNTPSCPKGSVRGIVWAKPDLNQNHLNAALATPNCLSTSPVPKTDVKAFMVGFATRSVVPRKPASN
jgi:5'-nucleotidase